MVGSLGEMGARDADVVVIAHKAKYLRGRTTEELDELFRAGAARVGVDHVPSYPTEVDGLEALVKQAEPGDVVALMCHEDRQGVYDWLADHGFTTDTPETLRDKVQGRTGLTGAGSARRVSGCRCGRAPGSTRAAATAVAQHPELAGRLLDDLEAEPAHRDRDDQHRQHRPGQAGRGAVDHAGALQQHHDRLVPHVGAVADQAEPGQPAPRQHPRPQLALGPEHGARHQQEPADRGDVVEDHLAPRVAARQERAAKPTTTSASTRSTAGQTPRNTGSPLRAATTTASVIPAAKAPKRACGPK